MKRLITLKGFKYDSTREFGIEVVDYYRSTVDEMELFISHDSTEYEKDCQWYDVRIYDNGNQIHTIHMEDGSKPLDVRLAVNKFVKTYRTKKALKEAENKSLARINKTWARLDKKQKQTPMEYYLDNL